MDPKFQTPTSFIPRKNAVDTTLPAATATGILTLVAVAVFIVAAVLAGGLFFWSQSIQSQNDADKAQLDNYTKTLQDPGVQELVILSDQISTAEQKLSSHIGALNLFNTLSTETLQNIRWKSFLFRVDDQTGALTLTMTGEGKSLGDIALQSDVILADKNFISPVIGDIGINPTGSIGFSLKATLDPNSVSYEQAVKAINPVSGTSTNATTQ